MKLMTFRRLKRLCLEVGVEISRPNRAFGEWELPFACEEGKSFNGQFTCSAVTGDADLNLSEFYSQAWEFIKSEATDITSD